MLDTELLAENFDHIYRVALDQIDFSATIPELSVQVLDTLQQE